MAGEHQQPPLRWSEEQKKILNRIVGLLNDVVTTRTTVLEVLVEKILLDNVRQSVDAGLFTIKTAFPSRSVDIGQYVSVTEVRSADATSHTVCVRVRCLPRGGVAYTNSRTAEVRKGSHSFAPSPAAVVDALQRCIWWWSHSFVAVVANPDPQARSLIDLTRGTSETEYNEFKRFGKLQDVDSIAANVCA